MKRFDWFWKLLDLPWVEKLKDFVMRFLHFWPFVVAGLILWCVLTVYRSLNDFRSTRLNEKDVKLWNKKVELTAEQDSVLVDEIKKLRENQIIIIHTHENNRVEIRRIPDDSLQYWADSLYRAR